MSTAATPTTINTIAEKVDTGAKDLGDARKRMLNSVAIASLVVGLALAAVGFAVGKAEGFAPLYLVGYIWATTIGLGALGFVLVWRASKAGWPVAARRHMEWMTKFLYAAVILFIPIFLWRHEIYHHWMSAAGQADPILHKKHSWLNETAFTIRACGYLGLWVLMTFIFRRWSFKQDQSGDKRLTLRAQFVSAPLILVYFFSVTFAGFDWVMSLDPHWYSTIFGIYIFAGGAVASMALCGLITVYLRSRGVMGKITTIEHQHDIGKMVYTFVIFWAYIAFSQFILIWYANIPEETIFYRDRWEHGWSTWSMLLFFSAFVIPFLWMLSRWAKRVNGLMVVGCVLILFAHFVDIYWLVMPNFNEGEFHFTWMAIAGLAAPAGILTFLILRQMANGPLFPTRDPRVAESMKMENI
jgi:hypothetical protein